MNKRAAARWRRLPSAFHSLSAHGTESMTRSGVARRCSDPQGIDNLHSAFGRGIIAHARQPAHFQPGRIAGRRPSHLFDQLHQWRLQAPGRHQARPPSRSSTLDTHLSSPTLHRMRCSRRRERHAELARHGRPRETVHARVENMNRIGRRTIIAMLLIGDSF
jgi:hypothetical protein